MVKLVGSLCIFCGGWLLRWLRVSDRRREQETRGQLLCALRQMAEEIRMSRTPLPILLERLGQARSGPAGAFFRGTAGALRAGTALDEAWRRSLEKLSLPEEDWRVLRELGDALHGDEEQVCRAADLAVRLLTRAQEENAALRRDRDRQTTALCFSAAALLVILLI